MNSDLLKAKKMLHEGGYTCVLCKSDKVYTSNERGVKPLLNWLDSNINLNDFCAADKVIGKAAAFLYEQGDRTILFLYIVLFSML